VYIGTVSEPTPSVFRTGMLQTAFSLYKDTPDPVHPQNRHRNLSSSSINIFS